MFFVSWNFWNYARSNVELFFLCMAVTFFIGTFCLLASCLVSLSTGGIISRTIYELVYHSVAFILYLVASILLLMRVNDQRREASHPFMIASVRIPKSPHARRSLTLFYAFRFLASSYLLSTCLAPFWLNAATVEFKYPTQEGFNQCRFMSTL